MRPGLTLPRATLIALVTSLAACGGAARSGTDSAPAGASTSTAARRGGDLISEDEIRGGGEFRDAYQIVERLRPQFLRSRGATNPYDRQGSTTAPIVYLNNQKMGAIETLRDMPAGTVREIRYFSARDAATRWGTGETAGGVIMVTTKGQ